MYEINLKNLSDIPFRYYQTNVIMEKERAYFPYSNFWRGEYMSDIPKVSEREAGFRPRLLKHKCNPDFNKKEYPNILFRPSTHINYPCKNCDKIFF